MPGLLQNHIAVVTGAGSGIGRAIALGYAREGAHVAVLDINGEAAAKTAADIRDAGGKAQAFTLDVTDRMACRAIAAKVASDVGAVSILVNNAGINRRNAFAGDPDAVIKDWQDIMAVNLNGLFNVTHAFLARCAPPKGASSISPPSSRSCMCARRTRRPTPPRSTACSASPARSPPNSARTACASTPSAPA